MLFYGLWMSRRKTGSDSAHQWRKRLLRTSAVRPHSDCCCHSGQLVLETQLRFGRTAWPCLVWKSKRFLMGMKSALCEMICCLHLTVHIHVLKGYSRLRTHSWANTQECLTSACQPRRWPFAQAAERQKHEPPVVRSGSWTDSQSPHALVWSPWVSLTQSPEGNTTLCIKMRSNINVFKLEIKTVTTG